jgi:UPF0716 protein FxsA
MGLWFLVFFVTPIIEMYLLIEVGGYIGTVQTVALVMLTAVVGIALLRRQGFATLTRGIGRLQAGEVPAQEMAEGILLAVAGALLITPGFVTDAVGFLFLVPQSRVPVARLMLSRVTQLNPGFDPHGDATGSGFQPDAKNRIFEGEFQRSDENDKPPAV